MLRLMIGSFEGITRGEFLLSFLGEENSSVLVELERFEVTLVEVLELSSSLLLLLLVWKSLSLKDPRHELPMKQWKRY